MKNILTITLFSILALTSAQAEKSNVEMCKTYIKEAKNFQATKETNIVSEGTMAFYKDKVAAHCGNIVAKAPFKKDFYAKAFMKKDTATLTSCKLAIKMAKTYAATENVTPFITHAHKINVTDNCGTLVAKKAPANCLFDVVDNSNTEELKKRCLASIEKAHAAMGTDAATASKEEVVANCGRLQTSL